MCNLAVITYTQWDWTQAFVAVVLVANFVLCVVEAEHAAQGFSEEALMFYDVVDLAFSVFYIVELLVNLYGHWFCKCE